MPVYMSGAIQPLPPGGAGRGRGGARRAAGAGGRRRRHRGARPGARAARLPGAAPRPLLPVARHRLRVAPGAAAPPRRACGSPRSMRSRTPSLRSSSPARSRSPRRSPTPRCAPRASPSTAASRSTSTRSASLLVEAGYERTDQVEERGQFAIRGGILDVFPATEDRAARLELFGDEIESIRWFSTFTQRSLGDVGAGGAVARRRAGLGAPRAGRAGAGGGRGAPGPRRSSCRWTRSAPRWS